MLLSAGLKLPKRIVAHGWWTVEGRKMSKSLGNVVDPMDMAERYGADAFRYFLVREKPIWEDGDFSEQALKNRINGELMAELSNLVARVLTLAERFDQQIDGKPEIEGFIDTGGISKAFDGYDLYTAINLIFKAIRNINKYVNEKEPWNLKGKELSNVLYNSIEAIRIISIFLKPFMPETAKKIEEKLFVKDQNINDTHFRKNVERVIRGSNLFNKI